MADISEWSPVDESNNLPPPNGFPEGMAPSGVNNGARAVMGAVRRFYDQTIDGTLELPYLKLSGGTLSGTLSATVYQLSGVAFAQRDAGSNYHALFDADGYDAALLLGGAASGYNNIHRAEHHLFQSNNAALTFVTIDAAGLSVTPTVTAQQLTSTGNVTAAGTITGNAVNSNGAMGVAGTLTAGAVVGGTLHANTTLSAGTSVAAPTIAASGNMSAANLSTASSISAGTWINAPQYRLSGVPIEFGALFSELADLRERVRALEERP